MVPRLLFDRREVLKIGAISVLAPLATQSTSARAKGNDAPQRSCIFILLQGGPSHHDLWDPKPDAISEIRGPFEPIDTSVAGIRFGELMAESAKVAHRLC